MDVSSCRVHKKILYAFEESMFSYFPQNTFGQIALQLQLQDTAEGFLEVLILNEFSRRQKEEQQFHILYKGIDAITNESIRQAVDFYDTREKSCLGDRMLIQVASHTETELFDEFVLQLGSGAKETVERFFSRLYLFAFLTDDMVRLEMDILRGTAVELPYARRNIPDTPLVRHLHDFFAESFKVNFSSYSNICRAIQTLEINHTLQSVPGSTPENLISVEPGSSLTVAFSGGKDSFCLSLLLLEQRRRLGLTLHFVTFNPKLEGFGIDAIQDVFAMLNCGEQLEIVEHDLNDHLEDAKNNMCSLCARFRRGSIESFCRRTGSKLCIGHHRDDFLENVLMTGIHSGGFFGLRGDYTSDSGVEVLRPMLHLSQEDVLRALAARGFGRTRFVSSDAVECAHKALGSVHGGERARVRRFIGLVGLESLNLLMFSECEKRNMTKRAPGAGWYLAGL